MQLRHNKTFKWMLTAVVTAILFGCGGSGTTTDESSSSAASVAVRETASGLSVRTTVSDGSSVGNSLVQASLYTFTGDVTAGSHTGQSLNGMLILKTVLQDDGTSTVEGTLIGGKLTADAASSDAVVALQAEFTALEVAPAGIGMPGLRLVLRAERPGGVRVNTPVNYRGVEVGLVQRLDLAPNSASADIHILIYSRYAPLVRAGSVFWNTSAVQATGSILKGIELELESLRTLFTGAIEFATPSEKAPRAPAGTVFFLHDKPKDEWLNWSPKIPLAEK